MARADHGEKERETESVSMMVLLVMVTDTIYNNCIQPTTHSFLTGRILWLGGISIDVAFTGVPYLLHQLLSQTTAIISLQDFPFSDFLYKFFRK